MNHRPSLPPLSTSLPPVGFEIVLVDCSFNQQFGAVYLNREDTKIGFQVSTGHLNPKGVCHGGAMATFADMQILAVRPDATGKTLHFPTIQMSINYLVPVQLDTWVEATVTLVKVTRTMLFTQALITGDGKVVASTSGIYRNQS
ncbi:MAG: PaaI family thioesterase [Steroidobacteraceae bacterium]